MSAREEILRDLRAASYEAPLPQVIASPSKRSGTESLERFVERAQAVGVEVIRAETAALSHMVASHAASAGVKSVVVWDDEVLAPVTEALRQVGIAVTDHPVDADAGITTADFAIAETGTLVLAASQRRPRATSLVPPRHIVVLPAQRITDSLFDLVQQLGALPSALTFITGPSRTADIELTPVRGVHGPVAVTVFITK
ncbi:MAG TPA: lactate utilization protein [bacterium]|nr:lactate utilization protein [bacterium]